MRTKEEREALVEEAERLPPPVRVGVRNFKRICQLAKALAECVKELEAQLGEEESSDESLLDKILSPQKVSLDITRASGDTARLTIFIPDLREAPRSCWGDWGPMYTVEVPDGDRLTYELQGVGSGELDVDAVYVESPMMADRRLDVPLELRLPLASFGIQLYVSYAPDGWIESTRVRAISSTKGGTQ